MWEKKPIDRMEMLHILGLIYARTAAGFGKVALQQLMLDEAKPTVRAKAAVVCRSLTQSGLLTYCRQGRRSLYKWNIKEWGPPSLLVADAIITQADVEAKRKARIQWMSKRMRDEQQA